MAENTRWKKEASSPLVSDAVTQALADAGCDATDLQAAYFATAGQGSIEGQYMVAGQVALKAMGIAGRRPCGARYRYTRRTAGHHITGHIAAMQQAKADGADIRGYFLWSSHDNLEWFSGYEGRFGVIYVDFDTQQRIPKHSAEVYARIVKGGG